ncbi:CehA/McbA family metallohydrolase [Mycobacterium sp. 852002-51057_SCH5723018]|uniref:CehA/McbA family metallohydrolase n=1 Tax=Mycobacterium sp. 852002-51057_SCH5723018 TaxID=1834094 RepID=UPI000800175B|nr:CehA/McbA family metallohydrolase [Mycobacterium sp. 852002-51057_SCH5723018]OBG28935.1 hypothetical protein A5764_23475 [Mycobacterium sp. 852002-51057_SCH5723018]
MTIATIAPGAITERRDTGAIEVTFSGRFGLGIYRWAYLPFEVPPGVRRIRVAAVHEDFAAGFARNVLDLGVFGPAGHDPGNAAGFRGWSGGARDGFVISSSHATPGYLAGPIDPGSWAVALGPVVLSPWGMAWRVRVTLERGEPDPEPDLPAAQAGPVIAPPAAPIGSPRWFRGDLHLHTVHSDGERDPAELVSAARAAGLDFIVSTEHNTNSANRVWAACRTGSLLVIPGEEVTTRHGHWLAVGLPPHAWVDWRYGPRDGLFPRFAAEVREAGGLVVAAHPAVPLPGSAWEFGFAHVEALEVWNGRWNVDDEVSLRIWQRMLRRGRRIVAVGGSDSHGEHQPVGAPQTAVHARELSMPAIVDGLRRGRSYIVRSREVACELTATCPGGSGGPGEALPVRPGAPVTVTAVIAGAAGTTAALITATGCAGRTAVSAARARLRWELDAASARFVRLEVRERGRLGAMVALTNPVWLA